MFDKLKQLSLDTAIYGISTMVGRFLNFLLIPFFTNIFLPAEYGVIQIIYAYIAIPILAVKTSTSGLSITLQLNSEKIRELIYGTTKWLCSGLKRLLKKQKWNSPHPWKQMLIFHL